MSRRWLAAVLLAACPQHVTHVVSLPAEARTLDHDSPFLKVHMKDGGLYVLERWRVDDAEVSGDGKRYLPDRTVVGTGNFRVPLPAVALFETNVVHDSPSVAMMSVLTGASVALTAFCLADTKACFGSCPTFYLGDRLVAEGFSDSIAPSLEATDVDAIGPSRGGAIELTMTNEALETHVVKAVALLAAPRPPGGRVFADEDGALWPATDLAAPERCRAAEGDCRAALAAADGVERESPADGQDLAAPETIELEFPAAGGPLGLVVAMRQTLMSTYLLYQGLAWLGGDAVDWLARVSDRGTLRRWLGGVTV